jgi:hypothetical protein
MKKRLALGTAMLLTLGTAVAGTFLYGHDQSSLVGQTAEQQITLPSDHEPGAQSVTPEMIAMWKATAASTDYETAKAPI